MMVESERLMCRGCGALDRFDVSGSELYARLRAGGVEREAALLLVEAFGRQDRRNRWEASRA